METLRRTIKAYRTRLVACLADFTVFFHGFRSLDTPLCFQSSILGQKRSLESLKKDIQRLCLISWIATLNIYNFNLLLRVVYYYLIIIGKYVIAAVFSSRNQRVCVFFQQPDCYRLFPSSFRIIVLPNQFSVLHPL